MITHLEPDILECEVKWALESITTNKTSGGDGISVELFQILKDDAVKVLHSIVKESAYSARDTEDAGSIPGLARSPGGGHGNPLQYSYLENPHGQRSLAGYSPWGHEELDTTERLSND